MTTRHGELIGPGAIRFERLLPGPIERVWDYLTQRELRRTWLADGPMELERGGAVRLVFRNDELNEHRETAPERYSGPDAGYDSGEHVRAPGVITACEPPRLLAFTWEDPGVVSEVSFELEARGEQVSLVLIHRRLAGREMLVSVAAGWHTHLDFLDARLSGGEPPLFWGSHAAREGEYDTRLDDRGGWNGHADSVGTGALRFERSLPGPVERVWDYLVKPELRRTWLADGAMELRVGGEIEMVWRNEEIGDRTESAPERYLSLSGYRCTGVVTACEPPRLLAFTWDEPGSSSEIRIELSEIEAAAGLASGQVRLILTHMRLRSRGSVEGTATGWHTHLEFLRAQLEGGSALPSYWSVHERYERLYRGWPSEEDAVRPPEGHGLLVALAGGGWKLEFERRYRAPLAKVWRAVTEPEWLDAWYPAELRFEGAVGGALTETFRAEDGSEAGVVRGRVTAYEPPRLLAFEIEGDPGSEHAVLRNPQSIRIELREGENAGEDAGQTELRFTHFFAAAELATSVAPGWHYCLEFLAAHLGEAPSPAEGLDGELRAWYRAWLKRS